MKILQPFLQLWLPKSPIESVSINNVYQTVWLWDEENWGSLKWRPKIAATVTVALRNDIKKNAKPLYRALLQPEMAVAPAELPTPLLRAIKEVAEACKFGGVVNALEARPVTPYELAHAGVLFPCRKSEDRLPKSLLCWWLLGLPPEFLVESIQRNWRSRYLKIDDEDALFEYMASVIRPSWGMQYWIVAPEDAGYQRTRMQDRADKAYIRAQMRSGRQFVPKERRKYHTTVLFDSMEHKQEWLDGGSQCAEGYKRYQRKHHVIGRTSTRDA